MTGKAPVIFKMFQVLWEPCTMMLWDSDLTVVYSGPWENNLAFIEIYQCI